MVANGDHVPCPGMYRGTTFSINGEAFYGDFFTLPLASYGNAVVVSLGPILWDSDALTMSFWRIDHQVC
jgi:hypothetical protein